MPSCLKSFPLNCSRAKLRRYVRFLSVLCPSAWFLLQSQDCEVIFVHMVVIFMKTLLLVSAVGALPDWPGHGNGHGYGSRPGYGPEASSPMVHVMNGTLRGRYSPEYRQGWQIITYKTIVAQVHFRLFLGRAICPTTDGDEPLQSTSAVEHILRQLGRTGIQQ